MAGQRPFNINPTGLNLFPFLGNPLANTQQFLTQLQDLRMPQPNNNQGLYGQDSYGRQKMQFTGDLYNREPLDLNDHGERSFRELYSRSRRSRSQERENFTSESQDRIQGLMDREIPLDFLFPEMGSHKGEERYGREELERQHYGSYKSRSRSPVRPKAEPKDRELSPSDKKYGARNDAAVPWNALLRQHCYLVPPLDDTYVLALSEKQPGCCAIFIGGLPSMADEDIIREIFSVCGPIEQISVNVRANAQVKHCQLRFVKHDSVERAVKFNGHVLVIGDGRDRKTKIGRIRVDYDKLPNDNKQMNVDMAVNQQQPQNKKGTDLSLVYTRKQAFHLLDLIRHDQAITESLGTLTHWLEKGECNRSTVNVFHTLLNTIHSLIRRLINKRKEHEQRVEKQKQLAVERANEIKQQCKSNANTVKIHPLTNA